MPNIEIWTKEEKAYLTANYPIMGDKELAVELTKLQSSGRIFTLKMVEKKRGYMQIKRTPEMLKAIKQRNKLNGSWQTETHKATGRSKAYPQGQTIIWKSYSYPRLMVKHGDKIVHQPKLLWEQKYGKIPQGHVLRCKSNDKMNPDPENWEPISLKENGYRNTRIWKEKCPELFEVMEAYRKMKMKLAHKTKNK